MAPIMFGPVRVAEMEGHGAVEYRGIGEGVAT